MKLTFDHQEPLTDHISSFFFRPSAPLSYSAGQYIELTLPHPEPDDRGIRRWFTLSSPPDQDLISITTKFAEGQVSTFKQTLRSLAPGTVVSFNGPLGDFVLPKLKSTPLVFVAGGIGITPFHSIMEWLAASHETRPIKLLYGVRSEDEIIFQDTFDRAGVHATIIVSQPSDAWGGERGNLSAELIMGLGTPDEDSLVYVSGPEPMVEMLEKDLKKAGLRTGQFVGDFFPNYKNI